MVWSSDRWFSVTIWFAALAVALALGQAASLAGVEIARNYNEGWNAFHALAAMTGGTLYPQPPSLMTNNYPPLSFFVVGGVGWLTGDLIVAGRLVSLVATLVAGAAVFAIARRMEMAGTIALFVCVLFLGKLLAASSYIGINDPQMLGHAFGCLGFLAVITAKGNVRWLALGALLLTAALFVKQMLVVQPLVLLIWLACTDRRSAWWFAGLGLGFGAIGLGFSYLAFGFDPLAALFSARLYRLDWVGQSARDFLLVSFAPLGAALFLLGRARGFALLCGLYAVLGLAIGLYFDGGAGVGRNALFDAAIGCALCAGLVVQRLRPAGAFALAVACLLPLAVAGVERASLRDVAQKQQVTRADIDFLRNRPGPAMCEFLSYCYWAGKEAQIDAFNTGQAILTGARAATDVTRLLDAKVFSTIQLEHTSRFADVPAIQAALARNYRVARQSPNGMFLVPR
ncbi:MAG TPA: 6-pyruvoyl-tetrahydropterin synthase-related protein [Rhizomicrobium sp.]|nr:6-pyruvoyl-tetrahydropterin synthase-related protein [Rhizomicrobium sp.]